MTRSMNTDALSMRDVTKETDSMVVPCYDSKMDQTRDKTAPTNVCDNPFDSKTCPFVTLGMHLAMFEESFDEDRQFLLMNEGSDVGSASDEHCKALKTSLVTKKRQ